MMQGIRLTCWQIHLRPGTGKPLVKMRPFLRMGTRVNTSWILPKNWLLRKVTGFLAFLLKSGTNG